MSGQNVLFIMSDQHSRDVLGAYGNAVVQTPNMDRLAAEGTLFENAYCNHPICVPSRASFATGRYVHEIGCWDNAMPYTGVPEGWGHHLQATGHGCVSIGKLHYRNATDPTGFDQQIIPMHVLDGIGDAKSLIRVPPKSKASTAQLAGDAGKGDSTYLEYDRQIRDATVSWLERAGAQPVGKPWCLFVSLVCPHQPWIAPPEFFDRYPFDRLPFPVGREKEQRPDHPALKGLLKTMNYDDHFQDEKTILTAIAAYYGMVSFLDDNIGQVLAALERAGLSDDTLVVYTADHGDSLGAHGFWTKCQMYEGSVGVPMILRGPGVPAGRRVRTPVSLVDAYPTIIEALGETCTPAEQQLPGRSLVTLAQEPDDPERTVFSEYHSVGAITGFFMVRWSKWKFIHYEGHRPQLFDLAADPDELHDLALEPGHEDILVEGQRRLRAICNPAEVNARAFADQARRIEELGGRAAVEAMQNYPYTPAPGEAPRYS